MYMNSRTRNSELSYGKSVALENNNTKQAQNRLNRSSAMLFVSALVLAMVSMATSQSSHADSISDLITQKTVQQQYFSGSQPARSYPLDNTSPSVSYSNSQAQPLFRNQLSANQPTNGYGNTFVPPATKQLKLVPSQKFKQSYASAPNIEAHHIDMLYLAEQKASPAGKLVLQTGRSMALDRREIIRGGCWDYLDALYNRAGVTLNTEFKGSYPNGPFVNTNSIREGDWLYYVNQGYNNVEHSGMFVAWVDRRQNQALILSYAGEERNEPGRYRVYDISRTYTVLRPY